MHERGSLWTGCDIHVTGPILLFFPGFWLMEQGGCAEDNLLHNSKVQGVKR